MNIQFLKTILSLILFSSTSLSSIENAYTISMPMHIDLNKSGSFTVEVSDNTIDSLDTISIEFDDTFYLSDVHGKGSITGTIANNKINFSADDLTSKTINYLLDNTSAGEWQGKLNVSISLDRKDETNLFIDGPSINKILSTLNPETITFSHNQDGEYLYDLSKAKDESVLLYQNGGDIIIANNVSDPIKANEDMSKLFSELSNLTTINNLNYIDMSNCTNMSRMFQRSGLMSLDVSSFDTSNVENMSYMFEAMHKLQTLIGLENFDVKNVKTFSYLLHDDILLQEVPDLTNWEVSNKCTDLSYMMAQIAYDQDVKSSSKWPTDVDYSGWDVSNVTNMSGLFYNAAMITTLDLSNWDTSKVTDMHEMFYMPDGTKNKSRLQTIVGIENFNISNVKDMHGAFHYCGSLTSDFSSWTPTNITNLEETFTNCKKLDFSKIENWSSYCDMSKVNKTNCFEGITTYIPTWYQ